MKIIPAILANNQSEFEARLRATEAFTDIVQIDVLDNSFVPFTSWADPNVIKKFETPVRFELHLMVEDVEKYLTVWSPIKNVARAIFHIEPFLNKKEDAGDLLGTAAFYGWDMGLAINPETPVEALEPFLEKISTVLFLGVTPGQSGQPFKQEVIEKIKAFKAAHPNGPSVAVDGGVNADTIPALKAAGAETFCVASAIFNSPDPKAAFLSLQKLL
ncbi:MAG: hypothetical protein AAB579_03345 [Patescibacteria group bacterium]